MFIDTIANRASTRGIAGVNQSDQHSCQPRLVLDKASQLKERPRVMLPPLTPANRDSVADTTQIFQSDTPASVFSLCNNPLTNGVIDVGGKPPLFMRAFLEKTFGCLRTIGLKFRAELSLAFSKTVDLTARIGNPIRVGSDIDDTQVNAEEFFSVSHGRFFHLAGLEKIERTISVDEVSLPHKALEKSQLPFSSDKGNPQPSVKSPDRDEPVVYLPRENTLIVGNTAMPVEDAFVITANLISIGNLSQDSHHYLSRESESVSDVVVEKVVEVILTEGLCLPSMVADIVGSIIYSLQRLKQCLVLLSIWLQLNLSYQLHAYIIAHCSRLDNRRRLAHSSVA